MITNFMANLSDSPVVLLLVINVFLLIVGCFLDTVPAIIIIAPMLLPHHPGVQHQSHSLRCCHVGKPSCWSVYASLWLQPLRGCGQPKIKMESMLKWVVPFSLVSLCIAVDFVLCSSASLAFVLAFPL